PPLRPRFGRHAVGRAGAGAARCRVARCRVARLPLRAPHGADGRATVREMSALVAHRVIFATPQQLGRFRGKADIEPRAQRRIYEFTFLSHVSRVTPYAANPKSPPAAAASAMAP